MASTRPRSADSILLQHNPWTYAPDLNALAQLLLQTLEIARDFAFPTAETLEDFAPEDFRTYPIARVLDNAFDEVAVYTDEDVPGVISLLEALLEGMQLVEDRVNSSEASQHPTDSHEPALTEYYGDSTRKLFNLASWIFAQMAVIGDADLAKRQANPFSDDFMGEGIYEANVTPQVLTHLERLFREAADKVESHRQFLLENPDAKRWDVTAPRQAHHRSV